MPTVNPINIPKVDTVEDLRVQLQQALQKLVSEINSPKHVTLSRDLDGGNKRLTNLGEPKMPNDAVRLRDIQGGVGGGGSRSLTLVGGAGGTSTSTDSAAPAPNPPSFVTVGTSISEDYYFIEGTWVPADPAGGEVGYNRRVKFFNDEAMTLPDSDYIELGPVFDGTTTFAVAGPFPKPQVNEGTKWILLEVQSYNRDAVTSAWVPSNNTVTISAMSKPPSPQDVGGTRIEYAIVNGPVWRFRIEVTEAGDPANTVGYEAFAQEYGADLVTKFGDPIDLGWIDPATKKLTTDWWPMPEDKNRFYKILIYPLNPNNEFGVPTESAFLTLEMAGTTDILFPNANFEANQPMWPAYYGAGYTGSWAISPSDHYNGSQCMALFGNAANNGKSTSIYAGLPAVVPNKTYVLEFYYKTPSAVWAGLNAGLYLQITEEDRLQNFYGIAYQAVLPSVSGWTKVTAQFTPTQSQTTRANIHVTSNGLTAGAVFLDCFTFGEAVTSSTIKPGSLDDLANFGANIRPNGVGAVRPALPNALYPLGALFVDTSENQVYKNKGNTWVAVNHPAEMVAGTLAAGVAYLGTLQASQIVTGTLSAGIGFLGTITAGQVAAGTFTGLSLLLNKAGVTTTIDNQSSGYGISGMTVRNNTNNSVTFITPGVIAMDSPNGLTFQAATGQISTSLGAFSSKSTIIYAPPVSGTLMTYGGNAILTDAHPAHSKAASPGIPPNPFVGTLSECINFVTNLYNSLKNAQLIS